MKLPTMTAALAALALACASTGASAQKTNQLSEEVKAAYAELFDAAGGNAWAKCQTSRDNPCGCATNKVSVTCKNAFIKAIKFPSNNLVGTIPTKALETLLTAGATQLDFSGNPEFVLDEYEGATCLALTQCAPGGGATCNFGSVQVCVPPTASPTLKPTTASPTRKPTSVAPTAAPTNQAQIGWQEFFDATAGKNWNKCSKTKTTPCSCTANANQIVNCNSKGQIQNITLVSNNLVSKDFTEASLTKLIAGGVKYINVLGNTGLKTGAGKCISAAAGCGVNGVTCLFPSSVVFCVQTASPTFAPTVPTAKPTTGSPTLKPTTAKPTNKPTTPAPTAPILLYWSPFFTATGGASWTKCSGNQANPCKCNKLTCNNKGTVIQQINLKSNNLVGNLPIAEINGLIAQGATVVNLQSNPGIVYPPGECVAVSGCVKTGVTCTFDVPACTTVAPTAAPVAATNSPTFAPIAGTAAPTVPTAAPTLATAAPTLATAAPTLATAAPTVPTAAPTGTAAPTTVTTAPTGTAAPTLPTAGPSVPASLSPTASNRTISPSVTPTNGTNGTTASPTKSAGAIAQVSYAAGSLLAAALVAALA